MSKPKFGPGYVYLMQAKGTDLYKVGMSTNPQYRLVQINVDSPHDIVLLHTILVNNMRQVEEWWHRLFRSRNVKLEWFRLDKYDVDVFCGCNGRNLDEIILDVVVEKQYYQTRSK